jgi:oligosaccharide repeat unit polymerase
MTGISVLCAVLVLLLVGYLLRAAQGRWLAPGPLMSLYWAAALALPPLLAPDYIQSQGAVWYVVLLVAAFGLGSLIASGAATPTRATDIEPEELRLPLLRWLVVLGTGAGLAATVVIQLSNGYPLSAVLSLRGLMASASQLSDDRYTGGLTEPVVVPLFLALTYAAALLAPFAARGASRYGAAALVLGPGLAATAYAIVTTARAGMMTALFLTLAGWVVARTGDRGESPRVGMKAAALGLLGVASVLAAFVGISLLRYGSANPNIIRFALGRLNSYAVGYMPAFSYWYDAGPPSFPQAWGTASLAGAAQHLGGDERYGQALTDWAPLGNGGETNIYTAWRYLITDFGWAVTPLAAALLGYLITVAWRQLILRPTTLAAVGLLAGYAWLLHSVTLPIFTFTSVVAAFAVTGWALSLRPAAPKPTPVDRRAATIRRPLSDVSGGRYGTVHVT